METWSSQGNGAPGGSVGSANRAVVSSFSSFAINSAGVVSSHSHVSSRRTDRLVGRVGLSGVPSEVRRMDIRAALGFFYEYAKKHLAVFQTAKVTCVTDKETGCLP